jgi:hypothetical protein
MRARARSCITRSITAAEGRVLQPLQESPRRRFASRVQREPEAPPPAPDGLPPADGLDELPLDGDMVELDPLGGTVVELEERGVDAPWSLPLFPELLLDPELSQATSDNAERSAAAISHFLSIMRLHPASLRTYVLTQ